MSDTSTKAVRWIVILLSTVAFGYFVLVPTAMTAWETWFAEKRPMMQKLEASSTADWFRIKSMEAVMAAIFFAIGASVGSFLNVVAYRLPLGIPLVFRRSRCPVCLTPIEGRDNVPLLGWLRLGGRCRHCGTPISVRYPLVEGLVGSVFLLLFSVQLISGGWNLANRTPNLYAGVVWVLLYTKWDLVGFYFYHVLLFSLLFVLLLVDYDRLRLTWRQVLGCSVWLALPPLLWPGLYLWPLSPSLGLGPLADSTVQLVLGGVVGGTLGMALERRSHLAVGAAWVGMTLGWQAVLGAMVVTCLIRWLGQAVAWSWQCLTQTRADFWWTPQAWTTLLLMGTLTHHVLWQLATVTLGPYWPSGTVNGQLVLIWLGSLAVLVLLTRVVDRFSRAAATVAIVDSEATAAKAETP
jgi:leader peptidase (prepilin peptidase)/N-methyltransferase